MTSTVLFFARHGETQWNAEGRIQGQSDVPLNEAGRAQASALGDRLRGAGIAALLSSDLARARATAEIAGGVLGLPLGYEDAAFRERGYGVLEGLTHAEARARFPHDWARLADPRETPPEGETIDALTRRMLEGARRAAERVAAPMLIVSHGRAIRALVAAVRDAPVPPIPNGGVYRFVLRGLALVEVSAIE